MHIIGIDLGTTNSEVAILENGQPRIIEVDGAPLLPSVVGLAADGALLVGQSARHQLALHPERTIKSIKRRMGEDTKIAMGDAAYTPQEISAVILRRLKEAAEAHVGSPITQAVITVPAYFSDAQRQATRDAGELASLDVVRITNEPTAAALAYESAPTGSKTVLVYDLGGGTFDVSVVRMEAGVTEVLASHGNNFLGGDDFDACIVEHVVTHISDTHGVDPSADRAAMARLERAAEMAKIALTDAPFAQIAEEYLVESQGHAVHISLELSRADYESMIDGYVNETLQAVHTALEGASLTVSELDEVLLVGGATRTPLIRDRLEQMLRIAPRSEVDPDLCVAAGAATQAAIVAGQYVGGVLVDVTPYTFGTSAVAEHDGEMYPFTFVPVIRKNTPIPVNKSEAFSTMYDGQTTIDVRIYQGEDPDALNNTEIGNYLVEGLSDAPAGNVIVTTFSLDVDGILQVSSVEKRTGMEKTVRIDNATARFGQEEFAQARDRLDALVGGEVADNGATLETATLLDRAGRALASASDDDKEDLVDLSESLRDALASGDDAAVADAAKGLSELLFYLES